MATNRPFAYNPAQTSIPGCIQVGDLAIGSPTSGFASTGLTWWGGPDEELGVIIAYTQPTGDHPTPLPGQFASLGFKRTTESAFVGFVNNYYNAGVTTPAQAKTWLNANGYWTSWGNIVTTNLTLRLDASDSASYPGSGNTWIDLVNPQQNITLVNTPTYTATAPSYFTFNNGSNQYGTGSGAVLGSSSYTKSVWFYLNSYVDNNIVSSNTGGHYMFFQGGNKMYNGHSNWAGFPSNYPSTATFSLNTWYNVALTFNTTDGMKLYINGNLDSSYTTIKTAFTGNGSTNIAAYGTGNLLNGRIAKVYCYDRSLTASEVIQNWNADKSKFGY